MRSKYIALLFHILLLLLIGFLIYKPLQHRVSLTPDDTIYTFQHRIHEDYFFYLMVIRQGRDAFLEYDQFTTEPTKPTAMHLYYLALGRIGKITGLTGITMYYIGMFFGLLLMYIFSWKLASYFFKGFYKFIAMILIFLASPFPMKNIFLFGSELPIGTSWWTNMDPYSRLTQVPHHFVGQGFMLASVYFSLRFFQEKKFFWALATAILTGLGTAFYSVPLIVFLTASVITLVIGMYSSIYKSIKNNSLNKFFHKHEKMLIGIFLILGTAFVAIVFVQSVLSSAGWPWSTFLQWEADWYNHKTETFPYTTFVYLISFGIFPLFIIPAIVAIAKNRSHLWLFILLLLVTPIAYYLAATFHLLPLPKIRFAHTAPYVFAGLLATLGLKTIIETLKKKGIKFIFASVCASLFMINIISGLQSYWLPEFQKFDTPYNTYIPQPYFSIIDYLNQNSKPFSNVFTSYAIGAYLPAYTKNNVYVGHMVSTSNFWSKYSTSNSFYSYQIPEPEAQKILKDQNIEYVLGEERGLFNKYQNILKPIYSVGDLTLYTPVY